MCGEHIVFASTRMGFKDEATYLDAPQPYGEIFVMRYDWTDVKQLTDNQWEEGTPAWQPSSPMFQGLHHGPLCRIGSRQIGTSQKCLMVLQIQE